VQRSSPSIGNLAAALAKAQPELINPEKSLSATIRSEGTDGAERSFGDDPLGRYRRGRAELSLCAALERARDRAQDLGAA
jgi:hypothetical protein